MPQPKNKSDSYFSQKKESKTPNNKTKEVNHTPGANPESTAKKDPSANLFEDNIRDQKKEGA